MSKPIKIKINGVEKSILVPDDATPEQLDQRVNDEHGQNAPPVAPQQPPLSWVQQQNQSFLENVSAPTMLGNLFKTQPGSFADVQLGIPERTGRVIGGVAGNVASDVNATLGIALGGIGKGIGWGLGKIGAPDEEIVKAGKHVFETLADVGRKIDESRIGRATTPETYAQSNPALAANLNALRGGIEGVNTLGGLGFGPQGVKTAVQDVGEGLVNFGQKTLAGDLKISKTVAKKAYGSDIAQQKKGIIKTIYEHDLTHGTPETNAESAMSKAGEHFDKADEITKSIAGSPDAPKLNPIKVAMKDIDVSKIADIDLEDDAKKIINNITAKWTEKGFDTDVGLERLIELKQSLNRNGKLFTNAVGQSDADALKQAIKKKMYLNIVDQIGEISPNIKALNTEGKKLLDAHAALSEAAGRITNREQIGLTDWLFGIGAGAGGIANPGSLAITLPILGAKKLLQYGKGSNTIMNIGRALKGDIPKNAENVANLGNLSTADINPALKGSIGEPLPPKVNYSNIQTKSENIPATLGNIGKRK